MLRLELIFLFHLLVATQVCSLQKRDIRATLADGTTVIGYEAEGLDTFQGIPYAQPPVGNLRLRPPQPLTTPLGTVDATQTAKACPQLVVNVNSSSLLESVAGSLINTPFGQNTLLGASEDCLTLNVIKPPNAAPGDNLPVIYWIFGGGFELGWSSLFNGSSFVADSIAMGKPVVWVAVNYRVGGFGLMPGKELLAEGSTNLALRDQRLGTLLGPRHAWPADR
jgi:carboxylesterase type B